MFCWYFHQIATVTKKLQNSLKFVAKAYQNGGNLHRLSKEIAFRRDFRPRCLKESEKNPEHAHKIRKMTQHEPAWSSKTKNNPLKRGPRRDTRSPLSTPYGAVRWVYYEKTLHKSSYLQELQATRFNTRTGFGTPAYCLRFANPAEATWTLEAWSVLRIEVRRFQH